MKIFFFIIGILILGTIATALIRSGAGSAPVPAGKYDTFAQCLKDQGATFYGAFWCPHCAAEKALFGTSVHLLPYVECSTPDASGQDATCNAKQIESYPTWEFTTPIKLTETTAPTVCTKAPGMSGENSECAQARSDNETMYIFPDAEVASMTAPTQTGNVWSFVPGSQLRGVQTLQQLSDQTGCALPQ